MKKEKSYLTSFCREPSVSVTFEVIGKARREAALKRFLLFAAVCCLVLGGCQNPFEPQKIDTGKAGRGVLSLNIGERNYSEMLSQERTIMPETVFNDFIGFRLDFTAKTTGNTSFYVEWENCSGTVELDLGAWDLSITAYMDNGDGGLLEAAKGELEGFTVAAGNIAAVNVPLYPIAAGTGTFSWNIDYPENVTTAAMKITRLDSGYYNQTFYFIGSGTVKNKNDSLTLDAGQYRVVFSLTNGEEEASLSEILHIYKNMESKCTQTFTYSHFPKSLMKVILSAWDNGQKKWNWATFGITAGHFSHWGINGITNGNFNDVTRWLNAFCSSGSLPQNLDDFKVLVDLSLVGIASEEAGFLNAGNYANQIDAESGIFTKAQNGTFFTFGWETDNKTIAVQKGGYKVEIVFSDSISYVPPTPGLSFTLINNGTTYSVSKGTATATEVVIPFFYEGKPVTAIAYKGFQSYSGMTSVFIPSSVTSVGNYAFYYCSGLTGSLTIPSSVTSIGSEAFRNCSGLTNVAIGSGVTSIGSGAFLGCSGSLTSITVESGNTAYRSEGNCLIRIADNELILGCKNSVIPSGVTSIGTEAFSDCSGLTGSLTIPSGVTSIGNNAFRGCSGLTSVEIPSGVTSIGDYAFFGCSKLTKVFYGGANSAAWSAITIGSSNTPLTNTTRYYYSETHPGTVNTHWRYVGGVPTVWD